MKRSPVDARTRCRAVVSSNARMSTGERPTARVCYATGNAGKFAEASHVFKRVENVALVDVILSRVDVDTVEIQGTMEEITARKCEEAAKMLLSCDDSDHGHLRETLDADFGAGNGGDFLLVEDVSLGIDALNGFPGPYCKPMLEAIVGLDVSLRRSQGHGDVHAGSDGSQVRRRAENIFRNHLGHHGSSERGRQARQGELE